MEKYVVKDGKTLKLGYTTGSCAAAAAKAAAWMLFSGIRKDHVRLMTPAGIELDLAVCNIELGQDQVSCSVEKDSGDDPDITKGTHIFARVFRRTGETGMPAIDPESKIRIDGGYGIGRVTKKGLDQPVGAAAINSVPRRMIRENVEEVCRIFDYQGSLTVIISAPEGPELAKKTFNPRLGIEGGISILGTTGIVEPMSEQSLVETIHVELRQRRAEGAEYVLLTPGNYGEEYIREHIPVDPSRAVMTSNFIGDSLQMCTELGFKGALLVGHIGKLVKIAGGILNTHSRYGDCRLEILAAHAASHGLTPSRVREMLDCATCDDALRILQEEGTAGQDLQKQTLRSIQERIRFIMDQKVHQEMETGIVMFSRVYGWLCETENAAALLEKIR
ncbi:MAG: cobalamin biosynthesis protein CbiD [Parasporobacterium sp.]|nr:cobalamin biosynthesis protein CbiD [Parasporobacterium sp.]